MLAAYDGLQGAAPPHHEPVRALLRAELGKLHSELQVGPGSCCGCVAGMSCPVPLCWRQHRQLLLCSRVVGCELASYVVHCVRGI